MTSIPTFESNGDRVTDRPMRRVLAGLRKGTLTVDRDDAGEIVRARLVARRGASDCQSYPLHSRRTVERERVAESSYVWKHSIPNSVRGKAELQARVQSVVRSISEEKEN